MLTLGYFRLLFTQPIFTQKKTKTHGIVRILRFRMWLDVDVLDLQSFNVDILGNFWPLFLKIGPNMCQFSGHTGIGKEKAAVLTRQMAIVGT
jgi:hypothetical protein